MAEILKLKYNPDPDGSGLLMGYIREDIYLNCDDKLVRYALPKPYEYADIVQDLVEPSKIAPTAKYVLRDHLATIESLDVELSAQGIDIFNLHGIVQIDKNNFICPPILEIWNEKPFNGVPVIVDGAHRLYIALKRGIKVNCIIVSGQISSMLPVLPLSDWGEVVERDDVPKDKRNYDPKIPGNWKPHEVYRSRIPGSTGPRIIINK